MEIHFSEKMDRFRLGVFNELAHMKEQMRRKGIDLIDLSIGSPDLPPPLFIRKELEVAIKIPTNYEYSITGITPFKEAISTYYKENHSVDIEPNEEILVLMGSQDGLVHLPMVLTNPGDIILVPDPGYTAYEAGIAMADAVAYPMPLKKENNYLPDLFEIPEDIARKAKMMILNYPGNPIPALATQDFFEEVIQFAKKHNIVVLHDFAYSELYYTEHKPISFMSIDGAKDVGVEFNSLSKSYNMAGCRVGFAVGNSRVLSGLNTLKSNLDYGVFLPIQQAGMKALLDNSNFSNELRSIYRGRRDTLVEGLQKIGWEVEIPDASMFVWAKVPSTYSSISFTFELIEKTGVVVTPGNAFGAQGEGYVRIALVKPEEILNKAIENISKSGMFM
ncbi:LL-diaminopimelate aminotransferase [Litchfieldia salsa]|uniref:Aminotransferase n=1 Tax=Litchfieldia salsa TaxID=930152 RepID=A0A1H0TCN3_9BACI|nr:LL-diaminopimelate aminotransferase [Litchfieldia salsa]SDP51813.1 Aspartate/methionine/tyrosine aminotransferase [Litchfieldia salsa]